MLGRSEGSGIAGQTSDEGNGGSVDVPKNGNAADMRPRQLLKSPYSIT